MGMGVGPPHVFNNGIMMLRPSARLFWTLIQHMVKDGEHVHGDNTLFINYLARHPYSYKRLPDALNIRPMHHLRGALWEESKTSILHFTSLPKPWQLYFGHADPLLEMNKTG